MDSRIAVVTGATGTLGSLVVEGLAGRGLAVVAVSRSGVGPGRGEAAAVAADLADDASAEAVRAALPAGSLGMLVHAPGLPGGGGVLDIDPGGLAVAVDLKAGGLLRMLRAVDERIAGRSRVVAIGGHLGLEPSEHAPLAGVANAALANLVRQLAAPLGRRGATVHLVAPGPFESPRVDALVAAKAAGSGRTPEEVRAEMVAGNPLGRLPTADEVAAIVVGLLDPAADALTGSTLVADGGARRGIF